MNKFLNAHFRVQTVVIIESLRETGGFERPDLILNVLSSLRICLKALPLVFQTIKQSIVISQDLREQETTRKLQ